MVLAKALRSNSSLTSLNLHNNQIGNAGATALAKALESNSSVTLKYNNMFYLRTWRGESYDYFVECKNIIWWLILEIIRWSPLLIVFICINVHYWPNNLQHPNHEAMILISCDVLVLFLFMCTYSLFLGLCMQF